MKKTEKINIEFLGSIEDRNKTSLYYFPLLGWNSADKFLPGISIYNHTFPEKKLEWMLAPMYSTGKNRISGSGYLHYNIYPKNVFRRMTLGLETASYGLNRNEYVLQENSYFSQIIDLRDKYEFNIHTEIKQPLRSKYKHEIKIRSIAINEYSKSYYPAFSYFGIVDYKISNRQILKPASLNFKYLQGSPSNSNSFSQISLEGKLRINYNVDLKGIDFRIFGGYSILQNTSSRYNWQLAGQNGENDFLYDRVYLGRSDAFPSMLSQQTSITHSGFKANSSISSNNWLLGLNIKSQLPIGPIGLFADAGMYPSKKSNGDGTFSNQTNLAYDFGLYIPIKKDIFEIYIPLAYSQDIGDQIKYNDVIFWQRIRFVIRFNQMNPFKIMNQIKP